MSENVKSQKSSVQIVAELIAHLQLLHEALVSKGWSSAAEVGDIVQSLEAESAGVVRLLAEYRAEIAARLSNSPEIPESSTGRVN